MAEADNGAFKPRPAHLYPVLLSLVLTGVLGVPLALGGVNVQSVTPFKGDTYSGASLNALFFVAALATSATIMFLFIRRGRMTFLRKVMRAALFTVCFSTVFWYSDILIAVAGITGEYSIALLALTITVAVLAGFGVGRLVFGQDDNRQLVGVVLLSAFTGLFLGASIPLLTAIILAGALVVYDIVAVFRGPVGAIAKNLEQGELPGAVFSYRELTIGMGDMVFYSLVATTAMLNFGILSFIGTGTGVLLGSYLGFRMLQKFEMFPGLPFALILGVAGMLLSTLL